MNSRALFAVLSASTALLALTPFRVWAQADVAPTAPSMDTSDPANPSNSSAPDEPSEDLGDIVVTATRKATALGKVPISITAFDQDTLDQQGVRQIADIVRFTPGVNFGRDANGGTSFSIRGVISSAGSSTTGVYIDDTAIQQRVIGFQGSTVFPGVFDLDRVEILRGPQGTLFGAGSQGGTVRFITPQPSLTDSSVYARAELGVTQNGGASYEAGVAAGVPLINEVLGVRASIWHRRDGGFIDRVSQSDGSIIEKDNDWKTSTAAKIAFALEPASGFLITPSLYYQQTRTNDTQAYWEYLSDPDSGKFRNGSFFESPKRSRFFLPALTMVSDFGGVSITSVTSYYDQKSNIKDDFSNILPTLLGVPMSPTSRVPGFPDYKVQSLFIQEQKAFSQELRFQSGDTDSWLSWVGGFFYQRSTQRGRQLVPEEPGSFRRLVENIFQLPLEVIFPTPLVDGIFSYRTDITGRDTQFAGFGEANVKPLDGLTITGGIRISETRFAFNSVNEGPYNNGTSSSSGKQLERPIAPKISVSYDIDSRNLLYATAAKGFRAGGANAALPARCQADLANINYTGSTASYDSDSVWSYEVGSKNRLFGNAVRLSSSIYYLKWSGIQQPIFLPGCGLSFTANLGKAVSKGFDLQGEIRITDSLFVPFAVGYNKATFDESIISTSANGSSVIVQKGDSLGGSPWTVAIGAYYDFKIAGHDGYLRTDYQFSGRQTTPTLALDPRTTSFNSELFPMPETHNVNIRTGISFNGLDISLFVNNLLNARPQLENIAPNSPFNTIRVLRTFNPRTVGLTMTLRR